MRSINNAMTYSTIEQLRVSKSTELILLLSKSGRSVISVIMTDDR